MKKIVWSTFECISYPEGTQIIIIIISGIFPQKPSTFRRWPTLCCIEYTSRLPRVELINLCCDMYLQHRKTYILLHRRPRGARKYLNKWNCIIRKVYHYRSLSKISNFNDKDIYDSIVFYVSVCYCPVTLYFEIPSFMSNTSITGRLSLSLIRL